MSPEPVASDKKDGNQAVLASGDEVDDHFVVSRRDLEFLAEADAMSQTVRLVIGLILIGLGVIGMLLPIIPGIPLLIAGVAVVGTNHPWIRPVMVRLRAWRRKWNRPR